MPSCLTSRRRHAPATCATSPALKPCDGLLQHAAAALDEVRRKEFFRAGAVMRRLDRGRRRPLHKVLWQRLGWRASATTARLDRLPLHQRLDRQGIGRSSPASGIQRRSHV
jgi:hypothetical protein